MMDEKQTNEFIAALTQKVEALLKIAFLTGKQDGLTDGFAILTGSREPELVQEKQAS